MDKSGESYGCQRQRKLRKTYRHGNILTALSFLIHIMAIIVLVLKVLSIMLDT